jgi:hypothetical protein
VPTPDISYFNDNGLPLSPQNGAVVALAVTASLVSNRALIDARSPENNTALAVIPQKEL